mmetsp:Transcript_84132/g.223356  ORF Transcript_84132/g.223356 Transcript_84132/m.223356 type:complete len:403 (-) Transcript_84132:161-1369(-)|eukprot:CAMPEP_0171206364 /NCGR_PEP_ID=MMETSP0790-20130122/27024_1 /TAXON_ID=2925 /ORGANISM="Alexandrium catenella, Strain OF101" /LENGTH=402 /DNA_ID=CAMNT_0011671905 /DNA_START=78 /DNA_END=1286 /DNA_ORIENTATION=+
MRLLISGNILSAGVALVARRGDDNAEQEHYTFERFVEDYARRYEPGTDEWDRRENLFNERIREVRDWQAGPPRSWKKGVTTFMDYTDGEYQAVLGYKGRGTRRTAQGSMSLFAVRRRDEEDLPPLPAFIDVGFNTSLGSVIRNQGACGSCWAEAATAVLESMMEKNPEIHGALLNEVKQIQKLPTLSSQAVLSCTDNPRHCGGKGGCSGATAELAFNMVQQRGLPLAVKWSYQSGIGATMTCRDEIFHSLRLGISGYEVLPSNKVDPLKRALVKAGGPIVVSVDATNWQVYMSGIYSDTQLLKPGDFTVNHAVVLMGYREPTEKDMGYWLIKNSWGGDWGEAGYIRIEMKRNEEEHCGWDYASHDGLACDGDPDVTWVCGTCGILYDSSYPTGLYLMHPNEN